MVISGWCALSTLIANKTVTSQRPVVLAGATAAGAQNTRSKPKVPFVSAVLARSAPWRGTALNKKTAVFW